MITNERQYKVTKSQLRSRSDELKPCPFCGSPGEIVKNDFPPKNPYYHPTCTNSDCIAFVAEDDEQGGTFCDELSQEACFDKWNTRH
jgi:hypothetical protein